MWLCYSIIYCIFWCWYICVPFHQPMRPANYLAALSCLDGLLLEILKSLLCWMEVELVVLVSWFEPSVAGLIPPRAWPLPLCLFLNIPGERFCTFDIVIVLLSVFIMRWCCLNLISWDCIECPLYIYFSNIFLFFFIV